MGLSINQNIAAVNAYHNLANTQNDLSKSLEKLSSGFRINRAADDAAGLAISEGLRSQIGGLKVAVRNAQDGTSVVQTAEGALNESTSILQRMRDLSVQASNDGGLSADAKGNIQSEMGQLKQELSRIANTTQFNGTKLLDGNYTGVFQVGANQGETITVKVGQSMGAAGLKVDGVDVTAAAGAGALSGSTTTAAAVGTSSVATVDGTKDYTALATWGSKLNGSISFNGNSLDLGTVDVASGAAVSDKVAALQKAADATFGTGKMTVAATANGITFTGAAAAAGATAQDLANSTVSFTAATGAQMAIKTIDDAISTVSTVRANLGAVQNRFDHTVKNLNVAVENLSASESRIRDTDMASEMVSFTRAQILSQAGTSMLAQANQLPQSVLKLLG